MFRVEIKNNGVWTPFYSTNDPSLEYGLVGVSLNKSLNEADSFAFTILPTHPLYNSLVKLTTLIRVYWDSVLFFDGRVASWTTDMYGQRQVSCESAISYLIDSVARSETKSGSSGSKTHKQTVREAIEYIIGLHNAEMTGADAYKQFQIGEISSRHADREIQYDVSSFQDVKKLLYATVKDKFGGYFRARLGHNQNGSEVNLIDYIDDFGVVNDRPAAVFTENIVEMSRD